MKKQATKKDGNEPVTRKEFNERLDNVDERFNKVDERFSKIDERFNKVDERFDKLELALRNQAKAILRNTDDINIIKETMATKDDIHKILTAIDSFAQKSQDVERKSIVNTHRIVELETKYSNLDERVSTLEASVHK